MRNWWLLGLFLVSMTLQADLLDTIQQKGVLTVGVKADYPPWGMRDKSGQVVGFEPDIARAIAQELGVDLEMKVVVSSNRLQKLQDGEVDLLIATLGDTPQRRQLVRMVEPHYFDSGVSLLSRNDATVSSWKDMRGQTVCMSRGSYSNKAMIKEYGVEPVMFLSFRDTLLGLASGKCVGLAYDDGVLHHLSQQPEWHDFHVQLPPILPINWSMAVRNGKDTDRLSDVLSQWIEAKHQSGDLLTLAQQWQLPNYGYLTKQFQLRQSDGEPDCVAAGYSSCGGPLYIPLPKGWSLDAFDNARIVNGVLYTLWLTVLTLVFSAVFAFLLSWIKSRPWWVIPQLGMAITSLFRFTPPILMLYIAFFGLLPMLEQHYAYTIDGAWPAVLLLSLYAGAGASTLLDHAVKQQPNRPEVVWRKACLEAYPGIKANLVNIVKAAGMASVIAVPNLILIATDMAATQGHVLFLMNLMLVFFFLEVIACIWLLDQLYTKLAQNDSTSDTLQGENA